MAYPLLTHIGACTIVKKPCGLQEATLSWEVFRCIVLVLLQGQQQPGNSRWLWGQDQGEKAEAGEGW